MMIEVESGPYVGSFILTIPGQFSLAIVKLITFVPSREEQKSLPIGREGDIVGYWPGINCGVSSLPAFEGYTTDRLHCRACIEDPKVEAVRRFENGADVSNWPHISLFHGQHIQRE